VPDARVDERGATVVHKRRSLSRIDDPFVRAVARLPVTVRTKLLIAFVGTSMLLVAVGLLGQLVLGQSNDRVASLGALRERAIGYAQLQQQVDDLRNLLAENVGGDFYEVWTEVDRRENSKAIDLHARTAVRQIEAGTAADRLLFTPPPGDQNALDSIRGTAHDLFLELDERLIPLYADPDATTRAEWDSVRVSVERLSSDLKQAVAALALGTRAEVNDLIARNASSFASSRALFIGVAAGALVLALLLGFILSWSLVGPIQSIDGRLAAIASGDFEGHVDVENRDELGALAANVNRMNDQLRRVYAELEEASRHKSEFLANMSHELRTPLNAIIGFSQVLREEMVGSVNEKQAEYLDDITSSGHHLLSLINDVLDLSKVEAGQIELDVRPFSLREALERGVVMVRERATEDGVRVAFDADPAIDVVSGDERRIKQVIFNLLSNAVKFTPAGGEVDVSATRVNGEVRVSVADTGPGIAPEDRDRIFEEFQQTEAGVGHHEGTGLGLALSKQFVELHGGRIWLDSELGHGSTFTFALPARSTAS
jgi:signal transduction histidine kinase